MAAKLQNFRVRVSWSPGAAPLQVEELSLGGEVLLLGAERAGGTIELKDLTLPPGDAPLLRWRLRPAQALPAIDHIRVEVHGASGARLLGELVGELRPEAEWRGERRVGSLPAPPTLLPKLAWAL